MVKVLGARVALAFLAATLAVTGCVHQDELIASRGLPGYNVFIYAHCGVAVIGNGKREVSWTTASESLVDRLSRALSFERTERGHACHPSRSNEPVLQLVLSDWGNIGPILFDLGEWLLANDYGVEIDAIVNAPNGVRVPPPRDAQPTPPPSPPLPCVATSRAGFTIYDCPSCGTAIVAAGRREFAWRRPTSSGFDSAAFDAFRNAGGGPRLRGVTSFHASGIGLGCHSKKPVLELLLSNGAELQTAAEQIGEWLGAEDYSEEIDLLVVPIPRLL